MDRPSLIRHASVQGKEHDLQRQTTTERTTTDQENQTFLKQVSLHFIAERKWGSSLNKNRLEMDFWRN